MSGAEATPNVPEQYHSPPLNEKGSDAVATSSKKDIAMSNDRIPQIVHSTQTPENFATDDALGPRVSRKTEEALGGSVLVNEKTLDEDRVALIRPDHFYLHSIGYLWQAFLNLRDANQPIDLLTVKNELEKAGKLHEVGNGELYGVAYLTSLIDNVPSSVHANKYASIVIEDSDYRKLQDLSHKIHGASINRSNGSAAAFLATAREEWATVNLTSADDESWGYVNLAEFVEEHGIPEVRWHLEGAIPIGGMGVIHGKSFSGKTWADDDLILATCFSGTCWNIEEPVRPGPVIYIAGDQAMSVSVPRLLDLSLGRGAPGLPDNLYFTSEPKDLGDPEELARLELMAQKHGAVMMAVDSVSVHKPHDLSENLPDDMTQYFRPFRAMVDRNPDLVSLFIHHDNIRGLIRGATTIGDRPEFIYKITSQGTGPGMVATLVCEKLKGADDVLSPDREFSLVRDPEGKGIILAWNMTKARSKSKKKPSKTQQAAEACIAHLQEQEGQWVAGVDLKKLCEGGNLLLAKATFYKMIVPKLADTEGVEAVTEKPMRFRWEG